MVSRGGNNKFNYTCAHWALELYYTALRITSHCNIPTVKLLIVEFKIDPDVANEGEKLISHASYHGHLDLMKYLVKELKCNVKSACDSYGNTPLHCAAYSNQVYVVHILACHFKQCIFVTNNRNETPLEVAIKAGSFPAALMLTAVIFNSFLSRN